jgi:hypothetical protein
MARSLRRARLIAAELAVLPVTAALSDAAIASPMYCGPRTAILSTLTGRMQEQPASVALTSDGQLLEVLRSESDGTWSIVITSAKGISCLVANGDSWQDKQSVPLALEPRS